MPINIPSQYEKNLSSIVTEAETAAETPKIENIRSITPSVVPRPPGRSGIILTSIAIIVTITGTIISTL